MTDIDIDHLRQWIGKSDERQETLCTERAVSLAATLDRTKLPKTGDVLPPLWHWAFFLTNARQFELGHDGHPKLGGFMPPVPLSRRMWVGGQLEFRKPLHLGDKVSKRTEIIDVTSKMGKSGPLVFVTLRHEVTTSGAMAICEEQDLVYRQAETPSAGKREPEAIPVQASTPPADWRETFTPDPMLLFRYSAITFNAHRIHYDLKYARDEESYPGLVVHGPLIATLLADRIGRRVGGAILAFRFRAVRPLFCEQDMCICSKQTSDDTYDVWAETPAGHAAMTAEVKFNR